MPQKFINRTKKIICLHWKFILLLMFSLSIRFYFLDKFLNVSGDLLLYSDWGEKFWEYGSKNFYFIKNWYYAPPNYPPLINLYYAYSYKAFDYKYLFAALHNLVRFPPASFIIYYYKYGYFINLKLLGIVCDILTGIFIYHIVISKSKSDNTALFAASLYLLNPITFVLSSVWGQTDSVIAILSLASFYLLYKRRFILSTLLFSAGLLFKPNWAVFVPIYLIIYFLNKPKLRSFLLSGFMLILLLILSALPFSSDLLYFYPWLLKERIIQTFTVAKVASVSAFNFYTTFLRIDYALSSYKIFLIPVKYIGEFIFVIIYFISVIIVFKKKTDITDAFRVIFAIALGYFIFMPGMLERYFFPALIPLILLIFLDGKRIFKKLLVFIILSVSLSINIVWALFRRSYGVIDGILTGNDFLLIHLLSFINMTSYLYMFWLLFRDNLLKLSLWKNQVKSLIKH